MNDGKKPFKATKLTLLTIMLASMIVIMGAAAVSPALRPISQHFADQSEAAISLIITLPALSVALTGFGVGYLADRFGKVKVLFVSLIIFTLSGISAYFLDDFALILVLRFVLGIGIAGISCTSTALIGEYWTGRDQLRVIGYQTAAFGGGTLLLETLGGVLADVGWREPFLIYLIGVPIILVGMLSVREPPRRDRADGRADTAGPARSSRSGILFCYAMVFLEMFLMFSLPTNMSYYIAEIGKEYAVAGLLLGVLGLAEAVTGLVLGRLQVRMHADTAYAAAFLLMGLALLAVSTHRLSLMFAGMVVCGASLGLLMPNVIGQLTMLSTAKNSGVIMSGYAVALNFSTFVSGIVVTSLHAMLGLYADVYTVLGVFSVVLFVVCAAKAALGRRRTPAVA